jgi:hypothetical protein
MSPAESEGAAISPPLCHPDPKPAEGEKSQDGVGLVSFPLLLIAFSPFPIPPIFYF